MGRLFFLFVTIALVVIAVIVATNNAILTTVDLYVESYETPLSIIILYSFIILLKLPMLFISEYKEFQIILIKEFNGTYTRSSIKKGCRSP